MILVNPLSRRQVRRLFSVNDKAPLTAFVRVRFLPSPLFGETSSLTTERRCIMVNVIGS